MPKVGDFGRGFGPLIRVGFSDLLDFRLWINSQSKNSSRLKDDYNPMLVKISGLSFSAWTVGLRLGLRLGLSRSEATYRNHRNHRNHVSKPTKAYRNLEFKALLLNNVVTILKKPTPDRGGKGGQIFRVFIPLSPWLLWGSQPLLFDSTQKRWGVVKMKSICY